MNLNKFKVLLAGILAAATLLLIYGCGEEPTSPPVVDMGTLQIYAFYETTIGLVDTVLEAPFFSYNIDDSTIYGETDTTFVELVVTPGIHSVYVEYSEFSTTTSDTISSGETKVTNPKMTLLAPDFTLKGLHYDPTQPDSVLYTDEITLSSYRKYYSVTGADSIAGEVVVLFYFGAG